MSLIQMALNWDHKQILAIMVKNVWVSQIQAKIFTTEVTTSWSRLSGSVLPVTVLMLLHVFQQLCGNIFKNNNEDFM